ncbi:MAG: DegT/DnrJ/EryC1/StrS family aminotransferase [bacterium]|nr:DegT/DnrJ/EryC1/StrS family aminotransferase [bacterium]
MASLEDVFKTNTYILGPAVSRFEHNFAERMKVKHAIGVNSGTDALLLTLHALGLQPGDEVIVPAFGFVATADVVPRIGATLVFVDVNQDFTIDVEAVKAAVTERTRVIIPVHLFGRACDIEPLVQISAEHGIHLLEDCCQATGAAIGGRPVGSFGIAGCFSFYPTKNLGGFGDGGMVTTNNDELAARLRLYRDHGRDADGVFHEIGYNSRLDSVQAALLDVKLPSLDEDNADRIANAAFYQETLNPEVFALPSLAPEGSHVYNLYTVRHSQRDQLRNFLKERLVDTAIYYRRPLHLEPCFQYLGYVEGHFPVAEQMAREVLSIPIAPGLTRKELDEVAHAMDLFAKTYSTTAG